MGKKHEETKELVHKSIAELRDGRPDEALVILEQTVRPKWWSINDCAADYAKAMELKAVS